MTMAMTIRTFGRKLPLALSLMVMLVMATSMASAEAPLAVADNGGANGIPANEISAVQIPTLDVERQLEEPAKEDGEDDKKGDTGDAVEGKENKDNDPDKNDEEGDQDTPDITDKDPEPDGGGSPAASQEVEAKIGAADEIVNDPSPADNEKDEDIDKGADEEGDKPEGGNQDEQGSTSGNGGDDANKTDPKERDPKPEDTQKKPDLVVEEEEGGAGVKFFLLVVLIGVCGVAFKCKEKLIPIVQDLIATVNKGFDSNGDGVSKSTKYQQV